MTFRFSKRQVVRMISFSAAIVLLVAGAGITGFQLVSRYRSTIEHTYQQALGEFSDYFTNLQTALTKGVYANTQTQQYGLAIKLAGDSQGAKAALSRLPLTNGEADSLQKYLAQVGDFANYVTAKLSRGEDLTKDDKQSLTKLSEYAAKIAGQIEEVSARYGDGDTFIGQAQKIEGNIESVNAKASDNTLDKSFTELSESFENYPSLVYDGPFADQVQQKKPRMLKSAEGFSRTDAQKNGAQFLNTAQNNIFYSSSREGNIPVYIFKNEDGLYISVTSKGGYVEEMYKERAIEKAQIDHKTAIEKAQTFLKQQGYNNMKESYYVTSGGICTINFAYIEDKTVCYSDLVKVGVAMDTGEVLTFNAAGYLMNHYDRALKEPKLTQKQAQDSVSPLLTVESVQPALIPTGGAAEVSCYEFTCTGQNGDRVLVYINADTGLEEQILILLQSDGGTLVI